MEVKMGDAIEVAAALAEHLHKVRSDLREMDKQLRELGDRILSPTSLESAILKQMDMVERAIGTPPNLKE